MRNEATFDFRGSTVIVTGGTRGIGRAIATGFALAGANVVIAARNPNDCESVTAELSAFGARIVGVPTHLGDLASVDNLVTATVEAFGSLDVVINNAATGLAQPIGSLTPEAWEKSFAVNLRGPVFLVERALPHLRNSGSPSVVNVISPGAFHAAADWAMYAAAKAGLLSFTRSTAAALGPEGIRVNALCPGPIETEIFASNPPEAREQIASATSLRRTGKPDEMVGPVLFLCSTAASYMTGEVLMANGGERGT